MTFEEYQQRLYSLRVEYANAIKDMVNSYGDHYTVISGAEAIAIEYRMAVQQLIEEYQRTKK